MSIILYFSTHGTNDPTRATMPFFLATGAIEAGHQPQIILAGEAGIMIKDNLIEHVSGVGIPPLKRLIAQLADYDVPIYI